MSGAPRVNNQREGGAITSGDTQIGVVRLKTKGAEIKKQKRNDHRRRIEPHISPPAPTSKNRHGSDVKGRSKRFEEADSEFDSTSDSDIDSGMRIGPESIKTENRSESLFLLARRNNIRIGDSRVDSVSILMTVDFDVVNRVSESTPESALESTQNRVAILHLRMVPRHSDGADSDGADSDGADSGGVVLGETKISSQDGPGTKAERTKY
ncbi:hypothetical protein B0H14DRAFT_2564273 [Mycena olivaceomarginata]|nr:hypothetical protein B0H14DRAFT_2564273 [Mycena olivaceomarginata]